MTTTENVSINDPSIQENVWEVLLHDYIHPQNLCQAVDEAWCKTRIWVDSPKNMPFCERHLKMIAVELGPRVLDNFSD